MRRPATASQPDGFLHSLAAQAGSLVRHDWRSWSGLRVPCCWRLTLSASRSLQRLGAS